MEEKRRINFKYNLSIYWKFLSKYKLYLFLVLLFVFFQELYVVLIRYLFKIVIDKGTEFSSGTITKIVLISSLIGILIYFIISSIINVLASFYKNHFINLLELNMMQDLKVKYFNHLVGLDHNFHVTHKTGSLISRLGRGNSSIERMTDTLSYNFVPLIFQMVVVFLSIIYFDFVSSIVVLVTVTSFIIFSFIMQRIQEESNLLSNKREDIEKGTIADVFTNIDSIKYFGKENLIKDKYKKLSDETKSAYMSNWQQYRYMASGQHLILSLGTFFIIYFPLMKFLDGDMTLGTITFIYTVYISLVGSMYGFVSGIRGFYRSMADFEDLFEYGKIEKEIKDKPNSKTLKIKDGEIEFRNMDFFYGKRKIFENFNLNIPNGKKIALVGHSGSGKTTLVKLLYRFYDINKGEILIDGEDITNFKQEILRSEMSIVPQECVLFDDTIYNNVAFSNPKATREEVLKAIKFAQLDKIIKNFSDKENTIVGERGVRLSGGEKQRVSIARAILANKKVLLLDEATSALDSETEHEIQQDLEKLMKGRTSIIIAHRLSTIMKADKIVVMKNGKIVQMGTHEELIKQSGEYKHLWNLQKGGYIH
ncbi:MAG: ABC transporter ATP-binding protein [Candidatus Pacearchaeota archaeon]|jgi:ATP-binding cassette subfamily B protein